MNMEIENIDQLKQSFVEARKHGDYIRYPERLAKDLNIDQHGVDSFGIEARYELVRDFLKSHQPLKRLIDIGGNCGYFSLSLLDEGLVEEVIVYDVVPDILNFGTQAARAMGLQEKASFKEYSVSLETLDQIPDGDVIICQNLIHHAGALFDQELVNKMGWDKYANDFLKALRSKYKVGIFAMAYKKGKPRNWNIPGFKRPERFREILLNSKWNIRFEKNVLEIQKTGKSSQDTSVQRPSFVAAFLMTAAWRLGGRKFENLVRSVILPSSGKKAEQYYLYLID